MHYFPKEQLHKTLNDSDEGTSVEGTDNGSLATKNWPFRAKLH